MNARLYVSSTYTDLKEHREAVRQMIRALEHVDVAMEYYVAGPERPLVRCLNDVRGCDLFIGLYARRYGYVPEGQDLSITEQEYRAALGSEIPVLGFLLAEDSEWVPELVEEGPGAGKLAKLRAEIEAQHLCGYFEEPGELAAGVGAAIVRALDLGSTPFDPKREQRLLTEWRTGGSLLDRERARAALRNMSSPRYLATIKEQLLLAREEMDVAAIADYLDELLQMSVTNRHAMPVLVELLGGESAATRRMSVFQIGELGLRRGGDIQAEVVRQLLARETDDRADVRAELAHTLSKIVHRAELREDVAACLKRLAEDPDQYVRERAEESIEKLRF